MHACTQQFVDRRSASVRLCDSFVNLDSCVENGFFLFFGDWNTSYWVYYSLPQLAIDLTSTPTMLDSSRHRSSISLTTAPGTEADRRSTNCCVHACMHVHYVQLQLQCMLFQSTGLNWARVTAVSSCSSN